MPPNLYFSENLPLFEDSSESGTSLSDRNTAGNTRDIVSAFVKNIVPADIWYMGDIAYYQANNGSQTTFVDISGSSIQEEESLKLELPGYYEMAQIFERKNKRLLLLTGIDGTKHWYIWHRKKSPKLVKGGISMNIQARDVCEIYVENPSLELSSDRKHIIEWVTYALIDDFSGNVIFHGISLDGTVFPVKKIPGKYGGKWVTNSAPENEIRTRKIPNRLRDAANEPLLI